MPGDHLRLLHRHSAYGYTDRLDRAMHNEPEAVSEEVQWALTSDSHARHREEFKADFVAERARIEAVLDRLSKKPYAGRVRQEIRLLRSSLDRIQKAL